MAPPFVAMHKVVIKIKPFLLTPQPPNRMSTSHNRKADFRKRCINGGVSVFIIYAHENPAPTADASLSVDLPHEPPRCDGRPFET
jgi:hypothetical protein